MTARRINRAARRYLLTGQPEPFAYGFMHSGGRWTVQVDMGIGQAEVRYHETPEARGRFLAAHPRASPVGKRNVWVRTFRGTMFPTCKAGIVSFLDTARFTR